MIVSKDQQRQVGADGSEQEVKFAHKVSDAFEGSDIDPERSYVRSSDWVVEQELALASLLRLQVSQLLQQRIGIQIESQRSV